MNKTKLPQEYLYAQRRALGMILKKNREDKGISLSAIAELMGYKEKTVQKIEEGLYNFNIDEITTYRHLINTYLNAAHHVK